MIYRDTEWKVEILPNYAWRSMEVYIWRWKDNRLIYLSFDNVTSHTADPNEKPTPAFSFSEHVEGEEFLKAFAEALAKAGYKPDALAAKDVQLDAVKYHLEDMRKLVFKERGK